MRDPPAPRIPTLPAGPIDPLRGGEWPVMSAGPEVLGRLRFFASPHQVFAQPVGVDRRNFHGPAQKLLVYGVFGKEETLRIDPHIVVFCFAKILDALAQNRQGQPTHKGGQVVFGRGGGHARPRFGCSR